MLPVYLGLLINEISLFIKKKKKDFDHIGVDESGLLERKFEREEILQVVHDMEGDKSPSSNGFTMVSIIIVGG